MKLEKPEVTQKKKNKKAIIIGLSTATILTIGGIAGWWLFKDGNEDVVKFAQSVISSSMKKDILAEESSSEEPSSEEPSSENIPVTEYPNLTKEEVLSIESHLKALGFGYGGTNGVNWGPRPDSEDYEFASDDDEGYIKVEALYALCEGKSLTGWVDGESDPEKVKPPYGRIRTSKFT